MSRSLLVVVVALLAVPASAQRRYRYERVDFSELVRAHADANVVLPEIRAGLPIEHPSTLLTVTPDHIYVDGHPVALRQLATELRRARAQLARATNRAPHVLLVVDAGASYDRLLLVARNAARAGAALSLRLVARTPDGAVVAIPVWVAPPRTIHIGRAQQPALITLEVHGERTAVRATRAYMERAVWARGFDDLQQQVGRLELTSGRPTYFITATAETRVDQVVRVIDAAREMIPNTVLMGREGLDVSASL